MEYLVIGTYKDDGHRFAAPYEADNPRAAEFMAHVDRQAESCEINIAAVLDPANPHVMADAYDDNIPMLREHSESLEQVLGMARRYLEEGCPLDADERDALQARADWLEETLTNYPEQIDELHSEEDWEDPAPVSWSDTSGWRHEFLPSEAIAVLSSAAGLKAQGLDEQDAIYQAQAFVRYLGVRLDGILRSAEVQNVSMKQRG